MPRPAEKWNNAPSRIRMLPITSAMLIPPRRRSGGSHREESASTGRSQSMPRSSQHQRPEDYVADSREQTRKAAAHHRGHEAVETHSQKSAHENAGAEQTDHELEHGARPPVPDNGRRPAQRGSSARRKPGPRRGK